MTRFAEIDGKDIDISHVDGSCGGGDAGINFGGSTACSLDTQGAS